MSALTIVGAGSVGQALGLALSEHGHSVTFAVRDPADARYHALPSVRTLEGAADGADAVILAVPASAVTDTVPLLGLRQGQAVLDATNAVRIAVPGGFPTMGDLVASLVPDGVAVTKAFNTVGAEHLGDGRTAHGGAFLPIAGDPAAAELAHHLATQLGFEATVVGGRDCFEIVEDHARLWIHLAFVCGWGRQFVFTVARP